MFRWILDNKLACIACLLATAFIISTIVVAVEKDDLKEKLQVCEDELNNGPTEEPATEPTSTEPPPVIDYRLPSDVTPEHYAIRLHPKLDGETFDGFVDISVDVKKTVNSMTLHNNGLNLKSVKLKPANGVEIVIADFETAEDDTEFLHIGGFGDLNEGKYNLLIDYDGKLDGIVGFYKSVYDGDRPIATSKFEPTYARQAFPCFDEPAMKAKFTVELVTPADNDYFALSNMDVKEVTTIEGGNKLYSFSESVPMSTYLACFIVCDFAKKTEQIQNLGEEFTFSVYATKDQIDKVDFALDVGVKVTEYYIDYFQIKYPLPKLDMIAIPDFVSGAMEHWGLVTYRETNLLHSKETTSPANAQNIARVVAHEISHMWFGNLVTMNWWNDLWLNEGFASYMQYKALDIINPTWKIMDQFLTSNTHSILSLDGTLNSHPIVQKVETPDQITAIFDSVTYNKGAAVIRMLEDFVGENIFQEGIQKYLEKHQFQNTVTQDLLDELELLFPMDHKNVTYVMDTWTKQMGLPVVQVTYNSETNTYQLTQKRFLADPDKKPSSPSQFNDKWYISITYLLDDGTAGREWFPDDKSNIEITPTENKKILKFNNDQIGYYRVNYDDDMWTTIKDNLIAKTKLTISDRAHILNDAFTLAAAGEIKYDLALDLSKYLDNEEDYVPWSTASTVFSSLKTIMSNSIAYIEFRSYVRGLLTKIYTDLQNVPEDDQVRRLHQSAIYSLACSMGHDKCLNEAETKFKEWLADPSKTIDPNLRSTLYYYGVQQTGESEWLKLWELFIAEKDAQEKSKMMNALAASTDPVILKRYLNLAWNEEYVRSQDHLDVIRYVSSNPTGTPLAWDHFRENWDRLVEKFSLNSRTLGTTVPAITRSFATKEKLEEMEVFFNKHPNAGAGATAREQAKETVQNNIKWLEKYEETVRNWLLAKP